MNYKQPSWNRLYYPYKTYMCIPNYVARRHCNSFKTAVLKVTGTFSNKKHISPANDNKFCITINNLYRLDFLKIKCT